MQKYLTEVTSLYNERKHNYRLIFGKPIETKQVFRNQFEAKEIDYFAPHSLFCLDLWERNDYGTKAWRVIIARTLNVGQEGTIIQQTTPAVNVLFDVAGVLKCKVALKWIAAMEQEYKDLTTLEDKIFILADSHIKGMRTQRLKEYIVEKPATIQLEKK